MGVFRMLHAAALIVLALACYIACQQECSARMSADGAQLDTLSAYNRTASRVSYRSQDIKRQCLRLRLPAGTIISEVIVWLSGPAGSCGKLEIFGHEGGLLAPRLERPLTPALALSKTHDGREAVRSVIDGGIVHAGGQLFLAVTDLPDSVKLMCSGAEQVAECVEESGQGRFASLQQKSSGAWVSTGFIPWIDVVVERPSADGSNHDRGSFVRDTLVDDLTGRKRIGQRYLSCLDVGGDGRVDIACAGVLLVNRPAGFVSLDLTREEEEAPYAFGLDTDGDGKEELLTMNIVGDDKIAVSAFTASETVAHRNDIALPLSLVPSSMSQYDVNADGRTDVVISGRRAGSSEPVCLLLLSNGLYAYGVQNLFDDRVISRLALTGDETPVLQFISPMAKITSGGEAGKLLVRSSRADIVIDVVGATAGSLGHSELHSSDSSTSIVAASSFMRDSIIAAPVPVSWRQLERNQAASGALASGTDATRARAGDGAEAIIRAMPEYEEAMSSIVLVDLDNDGRDEYIVCSQGTCRYMRVFSVVGSPIVDVTWDLGLDGIDDCPDIVAADFDLDGRLDLAMDRRGRLEVWMNKLSIPRCNWSVLSADVATIEAKQGTETSLDGQRWLHSSNISGRGRLIQDARSVQSSATLDSLSVRWTSGNRLMEDYQATRGRLEKGGGRYGHAPEAEQELSLVQDGQALRLMVRRPHTSARIKIVTTDGRTLSSTSRELSASGRHLFSIAELMPGQELASGQYTAMAEVDGASASCLVVIIR